MQDPRRCHPGVHGLQAAEQGDQNRKPLPAEGHLGAVGVLRLPAWPVQIEGGSHFSKIRGNGAAQRRTHGQTALTQ